MFRLAAFAVVGLAAANKDCTIAAKFSLNHVSRKDKTLRYSGIGKVEGKDVDMMLSPAPKGDWYIHNEDHAGLSKGGLGEVNCKSGKKSSLLMSFVESGTDKRIKVPSAALTIYDIDSGPTGPEKITVHDVEHFTPSAGHEKYYKVATPADGVVSLQSIQTGSGSNNPDSEDGMDSGQIGRSITMMFANRGSFAFEVDLTGISASKGGRNLLFSLRQELRDHGCPALEKSPKPTTKPTGAPTPVPTEAPTPSPSATPTMLPDEGHGEPMKQCAGYDEEFAACPKCTGEANDDENCISVCDACTPVDCVFGDWSDWVDSGGCSGIMARSRNVQQTNNECGQPCNGPKSETKQHIKSDCFNNPVDCQYSSWSDWSECESSHGQSYRKRQITEKAVHGGLACDGALEITRPCGEEPTEGDCEFDDWQEWTACSVTCGTGRHTKMRRIHNEAVHGGVACLGATLVVAPCTVEDCPSQNCDMGDWGEWTECNYETQPQKYRERKVAKPVVGGGLPCNQSTKETEPCDGPISEPCLLSSWGEWSPCDKTCGGGQMFKNRTVLEPMKHNGTCARAALEVTEACNVHPCHPPPSECVLDAWSEWSPCDADCGKGSTTRTRKVSSFAELGGLGCEGPLVELKQCDAGTCEITDCKWSDWYDWSGCSCTCGGGTMHRNRVVAQAPQRGGKLCDALDKSEAAPCNTQSCDKGCEDGLWSDWGDWSECSASCHQGYKSRNREVAQEANGCGKPLEGSRTEFAKCHDLPPCVPDADCKLASWSDWSTCSCTCFGIKERSRVIDQFVTGNGKPCVNTSLKEISPCNPVSGAKPPNGCGDEEKIDCQWGEWSAWSDCKRGKGSAEKMRCGGGQKYKTRAIVQEAKNGGRPCSGKSEITEPCDTTKCNTQDCVDCAWGQWGDWSECSKCGGQRWRHRSIERLPNHCGKMCQDTAAKEMSNCTNACADVLTCRWSDWGAPSGCGSGCGPATSTRSRVLGFSNKQVLPINVVFQGEKTATCTGTQLNLTTCERPATCDEKCVPRDCKFQQWSEWGPPSCEGLCERRRSVQTTNNECGKLCDGPLVMTMRCPALCNTPVPCKFDDWTEWSKCTSPYGQKSKFRNIIQQPQMDGRPCQGALEKTAPCTEQRPPVDCVMTSWTPFSPCTKTCGGGTQERTRRITTHATPGGDPCIGALQEMQACGSAKCDDADKNCEWASWDEWSGCSPDGQTYRTRKILAAATGMGKPCVGNMEETVTCGNDVVDCVMGAWTSWDTCDKTCGGGQQHRQRQIQVFDKNGGRPCEDELMQTQGCNTQPCSSKDCEVEQWSAWSDCSVSCGTGQTSRSRGFLHFRGEAGHGCDNDLSQTKACVGPGDCRVVDCAWGDWSEWSDCSCTCDGGQKTRHRHIKQAPRNGGAACEVRSREEVTPCNTHPCGGACINGSFGVWTDWSDCSASCGGGTETRVRKIETMANYCGYPPEGKDRDVRYCNIDVSCQPTEDCLFNDWSAWSDCSCTCDGLKRRHRSVKQYGRGQGKWCIGALKQMSSCNPGPHEAPPEGCLFTDRQDCELNQWSQWSECTRACDGGQRVRNRDIKVYPKDGGKSCDDGNGTSVPLSESQECNREPCQGPAPKDCVIGEWQDWGGCYKCGGIRKRFRHIEQHPTANGRPCPNAAMEEVGECPRSCNPQLYCTWQDWETWSPCSSQCGNGKRSRKRFLMNSQYKVPIPAATQELMQQYNALLHRTHEMESSHLQELVMAFACGGLSLVMVLGAWRVLTRRLASSAGRVRAMARDAGGEGEALFERAELQQMPHVSRSEASQQQPLL